MQHLVGCLNLFLLFTCFFPQVFGYSLFKVILFLSLPIALLKTAISLVHLYAASVNLTGLDIADRKKTTVAAS
ncbi:unnamed protein product [Dibothriocephalus latus]|uniref:Uncharacterized protein n=1 Tax=Dibothriocephalus latus TaxID=60516 RepID=A0A3P7RLC4_DIBLA|nr:unnamed protein product [Dibothriocephalus latus]